MQNPSQKIQLFISCRNLKDEDIISKSDPYVSICFRRDYQVKQYVPLGRTQTKKNQLNPNFSKSFQLQYIFESRQDIKFDVFDDDNGNDDFIGSCQTTIANLMGSKNQTSILQLKKQNINKGKIIIRCQKLNQSNQYLRMKFRGQKMMNTDSVFDFWDKSDPYLKFIKYRDDNTFIQIGRTNVIMDNLNPNWNPIQISLTRLVNPNFNIFKVQCWDYQQNGKDKFIGQFDLQIKQLFNQKGRIQFPLNNPKKKKAGKIILDEFNIFKKPSFIDYLKGGLQLNMIIAIDFTGSNGVATSPTSLHYMNPMNLNQYQMAITAIANILVSYDSDKKIPAFGFGGVPQFPGYGKQVNHCFPLSGTYQNLQATGLDNLMTLYRNAVKSVTLSGPTYFSNIIQQTMKYSYKCKNQGKKAYQTLLILTDGQIHDMQKTIDLIFKAIDLPLSIIIVGVGNADFTNMKKLDGDGGLFNSKGNKLLRDIVQFVPFRQVKLNPDLLAKQLLAELPNQVVQYMTFMGIKY